MRKSKRMMAFMLSLIMMVSLVPSMGFVNAAPGDVQIVSNFNGRNDGIATGATTPDGQTAFRMGGVTNVATKHINYTSETATQDLSDWEDGYFVFEMYITDNSIKSFKGNNENWFIVTSEANSNDWNSNSRIALNLDAVRSGEVGTWQTVYAKLSTASVSDGTFNSSSLSAARRMGLHFDWTNGSTKDVYMKNPRYQSEDLGVPASPVTAPTFDADTKTVTAPVPASGQAVEFAVSDGAATTWVAGTLSGGVYTYTFSTVPSGNGYFVYARAAQDTTYAFAGVSSRIYVSALTNAQSVNIAKDALTWDTIKGANASASDVTKALTLPSLGEEDTTISWSSSNTSIISNTGAIDRLAATGATVTLTATITKDDASDTKDFVLTVPVVTPATNALPVTSVTSATTANAPDGQSASRLTLGSGSADGRVLHTFNTVPNGGDAIAYANQYFVFDMMVTNADMLQLQGNNWLVVETAAGGDWNTNSRINLNVSDIRAAEANTWITVYAPLTSNGHGFNPSSLDQVTRMGLHLQWAAASGINTGTAPGNIFIKNPRFQATNDSVRPVPTAVEAGSNVTVSAVAPSNGQVVEFAVTANETPSPGDWVTGTLGSGSYTTTAAIPAGAIYYVFARTVANPANNFTGTYTRISKSSISDADAVAAAKAALTWDAIKNANDAESNVRTALTLPSVGLNDTAISWSSDNAAINNGGAVTRGENDTAVTLTATISKGSETDTVVFTLTVPGTGSEAAVAFIDFNDSTTWSAIASIGDENRPGRGNADIGVSLAGDNNEPVTPVSRGNGVNARDGLQIGNYLYVFVDNARLKAANRVELEITYYRTNSSGLPIEYVSSASNYTRVTMPAGASPNNNWRTVRLTLTSTLFSSGHNQTAQFRIDSPNAVIQSIKVTEVPLNDQETVTAVASALNWDAIKGTNTDRSLVQDDLVLNATGSGGAAIAWASSDSSVINPATGVVTRQTTNTDVTLTATISRGTATPVDVTITVTVRGTGTGTDADAVAAMLAALTWDAIKGGNSVETNVTTNLVLPAMGLNMTDLTWSSGTPGIISSTGVIMANRPETGATVALTATVSRGAVTDTKVFNLTVPNRYDFAKHESTVISTTHEPKDWAVSDFNVLAFGAVANDPTFCNREAFQAAINAAYADGGGVVYAPAGTYAFLTEADGVSRVPTAAGTVNYDYGYVLNLPAGVQLRGDWDDPDADSYDGTIGGTILAVYAGHGTTNFDNYVASSVTESQTGSGRQINVDDRFIQMGKGTGVTNMTIWHPNQDIDNVVAYPWVFYQTSENSATVDNVTLVNAYGGFFSAPSEMHYVLNSRMTVLHTGIRVHTCTDIGRVEGVTISPYYWADSGLPGAPSRAAVRAYTRANATGFMMHRSDWEYVADFSVIGYKTGMWVGRETGFTETPNAQFYGLYMEDCGTAIDIEAVNSYGLLISNSVFKGDVSVHFSTAFNTSVQFNGVEFGGPVVSEAAGGVISFEDCTFGNYGTGYALQLNSGNALLSQSNFTQADKHVSLGTGFRTFKSVNSGYNLDLSDLDSLVLDVRELGTSATVDIVNDAEYIFESIPKDIKTDIETHPKPSERLLLRVDLPRATGYNNNTSTTDVSVQLQAALDYVAGKGGGTVYLPGGRYLVNSPITIPSGVELRGTWDVQHHTQGGGTAIFTTYTGTAGVGESLIRLEAGAGIRGLNVVQQNLTSGTNPVRTPFLIQGQGADVYVINVTIPIGDRGIDLASYDTSGHYVDYLGGTLTRVGIWVGGGATGGFIRNMQFNPHYALRPPDGRQGYPMPSGNLYEYVQSNCSALMFADVEDQTIFNNFVFGSVYGVHFRQDTVTGNFPGKITMVGHGSDGCTFALYVEDADENTQIIAINSELVNTGIDAQPNRAYVRMGAPNTTTIHEDAELVLFNSAFWGSPTVAAVQVNGGIVRVQQANFASMPSNNAAIDVFGGSAHVYSTYFRSRTGSGNSQHARLRTNGESIELTNNFYSGNLYYVSDVPYGVYGSDVLAEPFTFDLSPKTGELGHELTITYAVRGNSGAGVLKMVSPATYAADFTPVPFDSLAAGESLVLDLPYYGAHLLTFELELASGNTIVQTLGMDVAYAEKVSSVGAENPAKNAATPRMTMDTGNYVYSVGHGTWGGSDDLSLAASYAWDDTNLYVYVVVKDEEHFNEQTGGNIWNGDSLQLGIDLTRASGANNARNELGVALNSSDGLVYTNRWTGPTGAANVSGMTASVTRDDAAGTTTYDVVVPFAVAHANPGSLDLSKIGVSVMINDADQGARRQAIEVSQEHLKNSAIFTELYLMDEGEYVQMLEDAADAAVAKAEATGNRTDMAMALNFLAVAGVNPAELLDALDVADTKADLTWDAIKDANASQTAVETNLVLPAIGTNGTTITWTSSAPGIISATGAVTRPSADTTVTLTATITKGQATETQTIVVTVKAADSGTTPTAPPSGGSSGGGGGSYHYMVRFNTTGGSAVANINVAGGAKVSAPEAPTREGYVFTGWFTNAALTQAYDFDAPVVRSLTLFAGWEAIADGSGTGDTSNPADAWDNPFADVAAADWFYNAVRFTFENELFSGTSATTFSPFTLMSRGMMVTVLGRMVGADISGYESASFSDVSPDAYYMGYIEWAREMGIVSGIGNNEFAPDVSVSRQDLAVILANYARIAGLTLPELQDAPSFADDAEIADYAREAVLAMYQAGIVSGRTGNTFAPRAQATRAEAASMFQRFVEAIQTEAAE